MNFSFTTEYNAKSLSVMAKGLRKTLRSSKNRRTTVLGCIVVALAVLLTVPAPGENFRINAGNIITLMAAAVMVFTLIFQDSINGYVAYKRMVQGMNCAKCTFGEDGYTSVTPIGTTIFNYSNISEIAENDRYFVFIIDRNHGQLYDKSTLTGGDVTDFEQFIQNKTGLQITKF